MEIKIEILDLLIKETQGLFEHHLDEMTKFEQRLNVLKSYRDQNKIDPSLN